MNRGGIYRAIEELYSEFARYPLRTPIEACPCCRGPQATRPLHQKPLSKLTADDLGGYTWQAMTTVGDVDDFRHFLPRILELLSGGELIAVVDQELVLSKLAYGHWTGWAREEQNSVEAFLRQLWWQVRSQPPDPYPYINADIGRWLCAIARAEPDLSAYLQDWENDRSELAVSNLQRFIEDYRQEIFGEKQPEAYWEDTLAPWQQIRDWARLVDSRSE